jgi:hypothetical protein
MQLFENANLKVQHFEVVESSCSFDQEEFILKHANKHNIQTRQIRQMLEQKQVRNILSREFFLFVTQK